MKEQVSQTQVKVSVTTASSIYCWRSVFHWKSAWQRLKAVRGFFAQMHPKLYMFLWESCETVNNLGILLRVYLYIP